MMVSYKLKVRVYRWKLFELALNPSDWIDDKSSMLRVKMSHTDDNIDAYISKKTHDEWQSLKLNQKICMQVGVNLSLNDDGPIHCSN